MILKGACVCLGSAAPGIQSCCCHSCTPAGAGIAATTTTTTAATSRMCYYCNPACFRRLTCCARGFIDSAGASGQGSCLWLRPGNLPCFTVCPKLTTYSAISLIGLSTFLLFQQEVELILAWLLESGDAESFLLFLVIFTFLSFPMTWGYILVNIVAGYRFGPAFGTCVVIVTVAIGSVCAFLVCRTLLSSLIRRNLMNEKLETIVRVVEGKHGFQIMALTRLTPIPFGIQNGVFALSKVPVSTFMLASFVGLLPTQFLNSYMGSSLRSVQDIRDQQTSSLFLMAQVLLSFLLSVYVLRVAQRELHRKLDWHDESLLHTPPNEATTTTTATTKTTTLQLPQGLLNKTVLASETCFADTMMHSLNSNCNRSNGVFIV